MGRLPGFDYKRPFFYMVTLKRARVLPGAAPAAPTRVLQGAASAAPARVLQGAAPAAPARVLQGAAPAAPALPFCTISDDGRVVPNAITEAFEAAIGEWAEFWRSVESVSPHVIMPDHLHLLIKLAAVEKAVSLAVVVGDLKKRLNRAYWAAAGAQSPASAGLCKTPVLQGASPAAPARVLQGAAPAAPTRVLQGAAPAAPAQVLQGAASAAPTRVLQGAASAAPIIAPDWHDWIVKKQGQLAAFRKYILENPPRHALRRANRQYFTRARQITFQGTRYWAFGNEALLELPVIVAIKGHRRPAAACAPCRDAKQRGVLQGAAPAAPTRVLQGAAPAAPTRVLQGAAPAAPATAPALLAAAARIGPGGAGLSTFLSPLEKEAGNAIVKAGGALIVLSMQGFGERWHPGEKQERLCAAGRMLYLSPYEPQGAKLNKREMHIRAHALVDWSLEHSHYHLEAWP